MFISRFEVIVVRSSALDCDARGLNVNFSLVSLSYLKKAFLRQIIHLLCKVTAEKPH